MSLVAYFFEHTVSVYVLYEVYKSVYSRWNK